MPSPIAEPSGRGRARRLGELARRSSTETITARRRGSAADDAAGRRASETERDGDGEPHGREDLTRDVKRANGSCEEIRCAAASSRSSPTRSGSRAPPSSSSQLALHRAVRRLRGAVALPRPPRSRTRAARADPRRSRSRISPWRASVCSSRPSAVRSSTRRAARCDTVSGPSSTRRARIEYCVVRMPHGRERPVVAARDRSRRHAQVRAEARRPRIGSTSRDTMGVYARSC